MKNLKINGRNFTEYKDSFEFCRIEKFKNSEEMFVYTAQSWRLLVFWMPAKYFRLKK